MLWQLHVFLCSVFIGSACNNVLGKFHVPYLTLPFNIVAICTFLILLPNEDLSNPSTPQNFTLPFPEYSNSVPISWPGVGRGILLSMGQVYGVNDILSTSLISLAVALYSPLLLCMSMLGATLGCLLPLALLPPAQYHQIYQGLWGYNPILSMAAVSCVFLPFSGTSLLAGTVNTVATIFIQKAIIRTMTKVMEQKNRKTW